MVTNATELPADTGLIIAADNDRASVQAGRHRILSVEEFLAAVLSQELPPAPASQTNAAAAAPPAATPGRRRRGAGADADEATVEVAPEPQRRTARRA